MMALTILTPHCYTAKYLHMYSSFQEENTHDLGNDVYLELGFFNSGVSTEWFQCCYMHKIMHICT